MARWHFVRNTWATVGGWRTELCGVWKGVERRQLGLQVQYLVISRWIHKRREANQKGEACNGNPESRTPPPPPLECCHTPPKLCTPPPSLSTSLPALHRSAYVVTNDTFIFLQSLCVCKTAEVHQDVKYSGWATQVALEDNQMEV